MKKMRITFSPDVLKRNELHFEIQRKYKRSYYDKKYNRAKAKREQY